ncbi:hypothetical protein PINS_up021447 [Pythium insidiosum]|nr:hypothetical protein PINS_up021447 [Pythium insidiosum]
MNASEAQQLEVLSRRVCDSVTEYLGAQLAASTECHGSHASGRATVNRKYTAMLEELRSVGKLSKIIKAKGWVFRVPSEGGTEELTCERGVARQMDEKMKCINDIDEELTELEDMVDQLEAYTASLQTKFHEVS